MEGHAAINLSRLLTRLESRERTAEPLDWWNAQSLLKTVEYAKTLADQVDPKARDRLDAVEKVLRDEIQDRPRPQPKVVPEGLKLPPLVDPVIVTPAVAAPVPIELISENSTATPTERVESELLHVETDVPQLRRLTSSNSNAETVGDTSNISSLLQHHREMQDTITEDLAAMARQLRLNTVHFSSTLQKDQAVLEEAEGRMEGNLGGMKSQGGRLAQYSRKGGATTCFIVMAVGGVAMAWTFMFMIIRLT